MDIRTQQWIRFDGTYSTPTVLWGNMGMNFDQIPAFVAELLAAYEKAKAMPPEGSMSTRGPIPTKKIPGTYLVGTCNNGVWSTKEIKTEWEVSA